MKVEQSVLWGLPAKKRVVVDVAAVVLWVVTVAATVLLVAATVITTGRVIGSLRGDDQPTVTDAKET